MHYDVITIGTATRDIFLTSPLFKVLRDKKHLSKIGFKTGEAQCFALGSKIEIGKSVLTTGGGAMNAAVTFSRQGFKTAILTKIGKDSSGREILEELIRENISVLKLRTSDVIKLNGTAYSIVLLTPGGERTILVYRGASENLSEKEISFNNLKSKWAYISPGKISLKTISKVFDYFYKNKTLIAFNPSKYYIEMGLDKIKPLLNKTKVVILNREEAAYLTGVDYNNEKEIFKKLDETVGGIAIMTDGKNGVWASDCCNIYKAGILKEQKVVDRTGAGDAFGAGFVAGLMRKREECKKGLCAADNIEYAIRLGSANATAVIEQIGAKTGILTKEKFENNKRWGKLKIKVVGS